MQIIVDDLPVEISRKKIKNMYLYVKAPEGAVTVTAPLRMPLRDIERFIREKRGWIARRQERLRRMQPVPSQNYNSGAQVTLLGQQYTLELRETAVKMKKPVQLFEDRLFLCVPSGSSKEQRERLIKEWKRECLKEQIRKLLPACEKRTGLSCSSWQVRDMKTRWGTCNTRTGKIWLSLRLADLPVKCLEYVIVHELAHLYEGSHNRKFKGFLDEVMPEWREVERGMKGE